MSVKGENFGFAKAHKPESEELFQFISELDSRLCSDYFRFRSGGDGDNGEVLMDYFDMYFAEAARKKASKK